MPCVMPDDTKEYDELKDGEEDHLGLNWLPPGSPSPDWGAFLPSFLPQEWR